jgi:spore coat protein U-like protein
MKKIVFGIVLSLLSGHTLFAKTITITAEFTPSIASPGNNKFTNTTPNYGYCVTFAVHCNNNGWFSVNFGIDANPTQTILAQDEVSLTYHQPLGMLL